MNRGRSAVALVAVLAVLTACTSGTTGTADPTAATVVSVDATVRTLAAAGIATVADEKGGAPVAPVVGAPVLTFTRWQVQNMADEANAGGGVTGADLDALYPLPKGAPPIAFLIGGWVSLGRDDTQHAATALFGTPAPDWHHADEVVFPSEVLALFVADLGRVAQTGPPAAVHTSAALTGLTDKPCSTITNFIATGLSTIFGALKLDPDEVAAYLQGALGTGTAGQIASAVAHYAVAIWNAAVGFFESAAKAAVEQLTAPVMHVIQLALGGLATFTVIQTYFNRQFAHVTAKDPVNSFAHGSAPDRTGTFTATLDDLANKYWPQQVVDCAQDAGVTLPELSRAGAPVTWTVARNAPALVTWAPTATQPLRADLSSTITYTTGHESEDTYAHGTHTSGTVWAHVAIRRGEIEDLKDLVVDLAKAQLPSTLADFAEPILRSFAEAIAKQFDRFTEIVGRAPLVVRYEVPATPPCSATPAGTYRGTIAAQVVTRLNVAVGQGAINGGGTAAMSGPLTLIYAGGKVTGSIALAGTSTGTVLGITQHNHGTMRGTISGPASAPVVTGTLASAKYSAPFSVPLHVTHADCHAVAGDLVPVFNDVYAAYGANGAVSVSGHGAWNIPRASR